MGVPKGVTREGFESHLGVNYFGHFVLTNLLLDTLKVGTHYSTYRSEIDYATAGFFIDHVILHNKILPCMIKFPDELNL